MHTLKVATMEETRWLRRKVRTLRYYIGGNLCTAILNLDPFQKRG